MATRFYLPLSGSAPTSPTISAEWEHNLAITRRPTSITKGSTVLTTVDYSYDGSDHAVDQDAIHAQFVSTDQLAAQTIAAQAVELAIQGFEIHADNNLFVTLKIFVCDATGSIKETLLAITRDGVELGTATISSRSLTGTTTEADVEEDDRLVFEIGVAGLPVTGAGGIQGHNSRLRWGEDGAGGDLVAATDSQTGTTLNPWLEFADTLTFTGGAPTTRRYSLTTLGVG